MIGVVFLLAAAVLFLFGEVYAHLWKRGIEVFLKVEEPFVYAGERAHFTEVVVNRGRIPLPEIEVRFRIQKGMPKEIRRWMSKGGPAGNSGVARKGRTGDALNGEPAGKQDWIPGTARKERAGEALNVRLAGKTDRFPDWIPGGMTNGPVFENSQNVVKSDNLYKRDIFALRPREQVMRRYVVLCPGRGQYPASDLTVKAKSFFHHRDYVISLDTEARLTVYAPWTDVSGILARCDALLGSIESRSSVMEDPFMWASIRAYTPQNPMRSINWKASARTGELLVNTYASVQEARYCVFLDAVDERIVRQDDLMELGISAAASLCRRLIGRGQEAGLYVYTGMMTETPSSGGGVRDGQQSSVSDRERPGQIPPARGREQLVQLLNIAGIGLQLPPVRGREQLARIEQILTADFSVFRKQKADKPVAAGNAAREPAFKPGEKEGTGTGDNGCGLSGRPVLPGTGVRVHSGQGVGGDDDGSGLSGQADFPEWAEKIARMAANGCICVFISKEEDSLRKLGRLLPGDGRRRTGGKSIPAVLVQPVMEDGRGKLRIIDISRDGKAVTRRNT